MNETPIQRPSRRELLTSSAVGVGILALGQQALATSCSSSPAILANGAGPHELPALPYAQDALAPHISAETLSFHYGKHHAGYLAKLNTQLEGEPELAALSLEELVQRIAGDSDREGMFNNAAQVWNHTFYWRSMKEGGGGEPTGRMKELIQTSFGDYASFKEAFSAAAGTQFGSGWAWLVLEGGKLAVTKTGNADTPMARGKQCLLTCDVWEHAYYLDYQNRRGDYVTTFLDSLVDWDFAESNLG